MSCLFSCFLLQHRGVHPKAGRQLLKGKAGEDHVVAVHDKHRRLLASEGGVNEHTPVPGLPDQPLDGGGVGADHGDEPLGGDHASIADIYQLHGLPPYSIFWTCSRIFSISAFSSTTSRAICRSLHFEPMVLDSRFTSWMRKSSFRPTGTSPRSISRSWPTRLRKRTVSSSTATL